MPGEECLDDMPYGSLVELDDSMLRNPPPSVKDAGEGPNWFALRFLMIARGSLCFTCKVALVVVVTSGEATTVVSCDNELSSAVDVDIEDGGKGCVPPVRAWILRPSVLTTEVAGQYEPYRLGAGRSSRPAGISIP